MERYLRVLFLQLIMFFISVFINQQVWAGYSGPALKLPMKPGNLILCTTQSGGKTMFPPPNDFDDWHTDANNSYYAIDFDDRFSGDLAVAVAAGKVIDMVTTGCTNGKAEDGHFACYVKLDHGGYKTLYYHLAANSIPTSVYVGKDVAQGEVLGTIGNTGDSYGAHLHFSIKYNSSGYSSTSELTGVAMEGVRFVDYVAGSYYKSTNDGTTSSTTTTTPPVPSLATNLINRKANVLIASPVVNGMITTTPRSAIHWYNNDTSTFVVQDYNVNTDNKADNWLVVTYAYNYTPRPGRAHVIRSGTNGFWNTYRNNDGAHNFGPPLGDEVDLANTDGGLARDKVCNYDGVNGISDGERTQCITNLCGSSSTYGAVQRFQYKTMCWNVSTGYVDLKNPQTGATLSSTDDGFTAPDTTSYTYTSLDLTSQVAVPYTDTQSTPTGYIHPITGDMHITFQTDAHRIEEMTFDGLMWTSTDVTGQAPVPYTAPGTRPSAFGNPLNDARYIVFVGDNARIQLLWWYQGQWSSLDLTGVAPVDYADLHSSPSGYIHPVTGELHVTFTGQNHRIYEITYNGQAWSSLDLTGLAAVPYTAAGTSPTGFPATESTARFVTFTGSNARIQLFTYTGTNWTSADLTGLAPVGYADVTSSPFGYIEPTTKIQHVVFSSAEGRIQQFSSNATSSTGWTSLDLSGLAAVPYAQLSTSPMGYLNPITQQQVVVFMGNNQRVQQFTGTASSYTSLDLTGLVPVEYAATGTALASFTDPRTGEQFAVFTGASARLQLIHWGVLDSL